MSDEPAVEPTAVEPTVKGPEPALGTIECPEPGCGRTLQLFLVPNKPGRVTAYCNHGIVTRPAREVYEADAPKGA